MIALVCGKWFPFYPATGNTNAHSPPSESIPSSRPWRCSLLFSPPQPKTNVISTGATTILIVRCTAERSLYGEIPVFSSLPCRCSFSFAPPLHRHFDRSERGPRRALLLVEAELTVSS